MSIYYTMPIAKFLVDSESLVCDYLVVVLNNILKTKRTVLIYILVEYDNHSQILSVYHLKELWKTMSLLFP